MNKSIPENSNVLSDTEGLKQGRKGDGLLPGLSAEEKMISKFGENIICAYEELPKANDFQYQINEEARCVEIIRYTGKEKNVKIPLVIERHLVRELLEGAFADNQNIVSVTIPTTVMRLGERLFENCVSLRNLYMAGVFSTGNSVYERQWESIEEYARIASEKEKIDFGQLKVDVAYGIDKNYVFKYGLSGKVTFDNNTFGDPEKGTKKEGRFRLCRTEGITIPDKMLKGCSSLEQIRFSELVTDMGEECLASCGRLKEVLFSSAATDIVRQRSIFWVKKVDDFLYAKDENETYDFGKQLVDVAYGANDSYKIVYGVSGKIKFNNATFGDPILNEKKEGRYRPHQDSIPNGMLSQCVSLEKIDIPEYIVSIGEGAFRGCTNLHSIQGMEHIKEIGKYAFSRCDRIERVMLWDGITIMEGAFESCGALETVIVPKDCRQIDRRAFEGCEKLTEIILPSYVEEIGEAQLLFRKKIDRLVINGYTLPKILPQVYDVLNGGWICADLRMIKEMEAEFSDNATYKELRESTKRFYYSYTGEMSLWYYSGSDACVKIPEKIEGIPVAKIDSQAFKGHTEIEEVVLPDSIEKIEEQAFGGCENLSYLVCPPKVKELGKDAIDGCSSLRALTFLSRDAKFNRADARACWELRYITINGKTAYADRNWEERSKFTVEIEENQAVITDYAGLDDNQVISEADHYTLYIPEIIDGYPVTQVGKESTEVNLKGAFAGLEELNGVVFPPSVKKIGSKAFYCCTSLETLNFPKSVKRLSEDCFRDCTSLTAINLQADHLELGDRAFSGCTRLEAVAIWAKEIRIGTDCFADCKQLKTIYFYSKEQVVFLDGSKDPLNITKEFVTASQEEIIEESPFRYRIHEERQMITVQRYTGRKKKAVIPAYFKGLPVGEVESGAFAEKKFLTEVEIGSMVQRIGQQAFRGCTSLAEVVLPEGLKRLEPEVFSGCQELEQVEFPLTLDEIEEKAFSNCGKLQEIMLPPALIMIGDEAFCGCKGLEKILFNRSLKELGKGVFRGCTSLRHIMLPADIVVVRREAFKDCAGLRSVIYQNPGCTKEDGAFAGCRLERETICDKIPQEPLLRENISYRIDAEDGEAVLCACLALDGGRIEIPSYVNGFPVTAIADIAFLCNKKITSVLIGENIRVINSMAFYGCDDLEEIVFLHQGYGPRIYKEALFALNKGVVYLSSEQSKAVLNAGNCTCPVFCMQGDCDAIGAHYTYNRETAELVLTAGKEAAAGQTQMRAEDYPWHSIRNQIKTVTMKGNITCVHDSCFEDCGNLKKVCFAEQVEEIGEGAFKNCKALLDLELPKKLRSIGDEAFFNCESLTGTKGQPFHMPQSLEKIGKRAFFGCQGFAYLVFPKSVQEIAERAFQRCEKLMEIYMEHEEKPEKIGGKAFYEAAEGCELSVKFTDSSMLEEKFDHKVIIHVPVEGECGREEKSIFWKLCYDGLLEMEGSGEMTDYDGITPPWNEYTVQIKRIVIGKGITHIGAMAFHSCNVEKAELPDGLVSIGREAFAYCINLSDVKIPSSVVSVGKDCFVGCKYQKK